MISGIIASFLVIFALLLLYISIKRAIKQRQEAIALVVKTWTTPDKEGNIPINAVIDGVGQRLASCIVKSIRMQLLQAASVESRKQSTELVNQSVSNDSWLIKLLPLAGRYLGIKDSDLAGMLMALNTVKSNNKGKPEETENISQYGEVL